MNLKLTDENKLINFSSKGKYNLVFIGGFSVENKGQFEIEIKNKETEFKIPIKIPFLKVREWIGFKRAVRYANFEIKKEGDYLINFKNISDLKINKSMLIIKKILFPSNLSAESIIVEIRK